MVGVDVKYPEVTVPLSELDGNVMVLIANTRRGLRDHGVDADAIDAFTAEAKSGDYDHALQTIMAWVGTS